MLPTKTVPFNRFYWLVRLGNRTARLLTRNAGDTRCEGKINFEEFYQNLSASSN